MSDGARGGAGRRADGRAEPDDAATRSGESALLGDTLVNVRVQQERISTSEPPTEAHLLSFNMTDTVLC